MWIKSIKLTNFKSYRNAEFRFPEPQKGENLVLIGAENGHGKTTLLEAIYLCLYDKDAISQLQRAGLNLDETKYPLFLANALHHEAEMNHQIYNMSLEIEIAHRNHSGQQQSLQITRKWSFDNKKSLNIQDNEVRIWVIKDGFPKPVAVDEINHLLSEYAVPFEYAPFYFFDGEKIVRAAEQSGAGFWLRKALQGLLGVTLLNNLKSSIEDYRKKCISENASQKVLESLRQAEEKLAYAQDILERQREILMQAQADERQWIERRDRLTNQLGGSTNITTSADLMTLRNKAEKEQENFKQNIKATVEAMPLAFLPDEKIKALQTKLIHEANRLNHEAGKHQIAGRVEEFWDAFVHSAKVKEVLGRSAATILEDELMRQAVNECWDKLFYPLPENCADQISHNYLSQQAHAEINSEIAKLGKMPTSNLSDLIEQIALKEKLYKDLTVQIDQLKNSSNDELVEDLKNANEQVRAKAEEKGRIQQNLNRSQTTANNAQKEVEKLRDDVNENNPKQVRYNRAKKVELFIEKLTERLLQEKSSLLGRVATRINNEIAHDERIAKIDITSTGQMQLRSKDGSDVSDGALSAGQMQILIMSLVSALAEVTQYKAPLVIDTPLARLDDGHRQGLFKHWSGLSQQVILLSQDAEITKEVYAQLKPHVNTTYLVKAISLASGGARSVVTANAYFE